MIKIGSFFEEYVEKIFLVIVGLVCVWLLITRVIFSPNEVAYGDGKYSPGSVDDQVYEEAVLLRDKINTPPTDPEPYQSKLSEFVALLDSSISDIDVKLWPQVPYAVDGVISGTAGQYRLPRIGEVNDVAVEHIRAVAYVPTVAVTAESPYDKAPHEPNDIDLVTVEAKFDIEGLYERFKYSFVDDVAEQVADPCLAKPIFAAVQLQRQELVEDGSWSDWQVVPRSKIDHYGKLFEIGEDASGLPTGRLKVWKLQFDDPQLQIDLLQPEAYQIASAKEEWYPPVIHRQFLDMQRREDSEERRKEREEEQKSNESTDSRRSRRTPTRSGSSTSGRAGGGLYSGGRGGTDSPYGGVGAGTTRRRSGDRRRSTDDALGGLSPGLRSTDRRSRGSRSTRGRSDIGGYEDYMMPGLPGDRLTRRGPSMNDVYDEFDKIRLTWRTPLEKMREPLVFWAHDDTVEPTKSYRYRIRLGVFNPVAGTNQLSEQDISRKNEVVLWSEFSDVTEPVEIPGRLYFFAKHIREAAKEVTIQVSKYVMGYWHSENFLVSKGEDIGHLVETEPEKPKTSRLDPRSRLDPLISSVAGVRSEKQSVVPEKIDYSTGAVMVDAVAVNDWSGVQSLSTRRYYDMLYSTFDGTDIKHMPARQACWAADLQNRYSEIVKMQRDKPEPFKDFNTSGRRRGSMRGLEYEDYGGMEDMMMMEGMRIR